MFLNPQSLDTSMGTPKSPTSKKNNLLDISGVNDRRKSFVFNETTLDKGLHHWEEYKVQGKKISRRSYQSSVFYKQAMYVYGGYELNQGILQDFISVNLEGDLPYLQWDDVDASKELTPGLNHFLLVSLNANRPTLQTFCSRVQGQNVCLWRSSGKLKKYQSVHCL